MNTPIPQKITVLHYVKINFLIFKFPLSSFLFLDTGLPYLFGIEISGNKLRCVLCVPFVGKYFSDL